MPKRPYPLLVGRTTLVVMGAAGAILSHADLKRELQAHDRSSDLHSQTSQQVLEELSEEFTSWFETSEIGDENRACTAVIPVVWRYTRE